MMRFVPADERVRVPRTHDCPADVDSLRCRNGRLKTHSRSGLHRRYRLAVFAERAMAEISWFGAAAGHANSIFPDSINSYTVGTARGCGIVAVNSILAHSEAG